MEGINNLLELPPPIESIPYFYGDVEQYLDATASESQSPSESSYDMPYATDPSNAPSVYPSPEREDEPSQTPKPATKRKRENRYKNAPPSVLSRRRAQNRASQRAYRERKDQRIKDLEAMLQEAKQNNDVLSKAYGALQAEYMQLKMEQSRSQPQVKDPGHAHPYLEQHTSQHPQLQHHQQVYPAAGPPALDPSSMAVVHDGEALEMDMFVYGHMGSGYQL